MKYLPTHLNLSAVSLLLALSACGDGQSTKKPSIPSDIPQATVIRMEVDADGFLIGEPTVRTLGSATAATDANAVTQAFERSAEPARIDELDMDSSSQAWGFFFFPSKHSCGAKWQHACPSVNNHQPAKAPAPVPAKYSQEPAQKPAQEPSQWPAQQPAKMPEMKSEPKVAQEPSQWPDQQPAKMPEMKSEPKVAQEPAQYPAQEPVVKYEEKPAQLPAQEPVVKYEEKPAQEPVMKHEEKPVQEPVMKHEEKPAQEPVAKVDQKPTQEPAQLPMPKAEPKVAQEPAQTPTQLPSQNPMQSPAQHMQQSNQQMSNCNSYYHRSYGYVPCYNSHTYWRNSYVPHYYARGNAYGYRFGNYMRIGRYVYYYYTNPYYRW